MAVGAFNNNGSTNLKTADGDGSINAPYIPSVAVNGMAAAAAAADNTANPTTTSVIVFGMLWDGATWDRMPGTAADGVLVNLGTNNDVSLNAGTNNIGDVDVASIAAGETHIGEVGANQSVVTDNPTVDTAAYASGDAIGGKRTLTNAMRVSGGTGLLQQVTLLNRSASQNKALRIYLFNGDPAAATITDNAPFVSSTDDFKIIDVIDIAVGDWVAIDNSKFVCSKRNLAIPVKAVGSRNLFAAYVDGGGALDFVNATDLQVEYKFLCD